MEGVELLAEEVERPAGVEGALGVVEVAGSGASLNSRESDAESRGDRSGWRDAVEMNVLLCPARRRRFERPAVPCQKAEIRKCEGGNQGVCAPESHTQFTDTVWSTDNID